MVLRYCNGEDPSLIDGAGNRGNCGKTFDDRDRLTICPHGRFTKNLAMALADGLGDGWLTMKISDARDYVFRNEYTPSADDWGRVFVLCRPCAAPESTRKPDDTWVPWAIVANVWELLAWLESHERERHAEVAGIVMPISPAGPDVATPIADSITGWKPCRAVNSDGLGCTERRGHDGRHIDVFTSGHSWTGIDVCRVVDFQHPDEIWCTLPVGHGGGSKVHQAWDAGGLLSEWRSVVPEDEQDRAPARGFPLGLLGARKPDATSRAPGWLGVPGDWAGLPGLVDASVAGIDVPAGPAELARSRARHPSAVGIVPRQLVRGDQVDADDVEPDDLVEIGQIEGVPIMAPRADVADHCPGEYPVDDASALRCVLDPGHEGEHMARSHRTGTVRWSDPAPAAEAEQGSGDDAPA